MTNKKTEKQKKVFKEFVKKHGPAIVVCTGAGLLWYVCGSYYKKGVRTGSRLGCIIMIDWLDEHFDNLNLKALLEDWVKKNPDKIE